MIKWPSCQPCCAWICTSPGLWLQMSSIPAPESESSVCLRHTEVALDSWRNQSVHCSASDLHAQQTSSVHHSDSALNMLTSRKKEASPSKALLVKIHLSFSKDTIHNEMATKPNITDHKTATKALRFSLLSTATCVRGRQIKNTNTKKGWVG